MKSPNSASYSSIFENLNTLQFCANSFESCDVKESMAVKKFESCDGRDVIGVWKSFERNNFCVIFYMRQNYEVVTKTNFKLCVIQRKFEKKTAKIITRKRSIVNHHTT